MIVDTKKSTIILLFMEENATIKIIHFRRNKFYE